MPIFAAALEYDARRTKRRRILTGVGIAAVLIMGLGALGIWYQFFRDDAPPPASLDAAVAVVNSSPTTSVEPPVTATTEPAISTPDVVEPTPTTSTSAPGSTATIERDTPEPTQTIIPSQPASTEVPAETTTTEATTASSPLTGQWAVVVSNDAFIGYRIGEELASIGTTEAVGRTSQVEGSATIEGLTLTTATITADMTTLASDAERRHQALGRQGLETNTYPTATFELTSPGELLDSLANGESASVTAIGNLTLHGVTNAVSIPLDLQLANDTLVVVGSLEIVLADYNIAKPSAPSVVSVSDSGVLELQLFFSRS